MKYAQRPVYARAAIDACCRMKRGAQAQAPDFQGANVRTDDVVMPAGWEKVYENWHYAAAVRDGDHLRCSGVIGVDRTGALSQDPEVQFRNAFERVAAVLAAAGLSFADVVEMTTHHVSLQQHWATFMKVRDAFVHAPYPAWTAVGVTELARPGALVEIKVDARLR
jgi:enamine deaminase RidA (YjgF/YER057c/UK114 family)